MNIHEFITISTAPTRDGSSGLSLNANFTHTLELNISTSTESFDYGIMYSHPPLLSPTQLRPLKQKS